MVFKFLSCNNFFLVFVDFLSKYLSLPIFGQTLAMTPNGKILHDQSHNENEKVKKWIGLNRWSFFEKSRIFAQYKLARFLMEVQLSDIDDKYVAIQQNIFSKMSKFGEFCSFLATVENGISLVHYFVDVHVYMVSLDWRLHDRIRSTYLNPGHRKCLPYQLLKHFSKNEITKKCKITLKTRLLSDLNLNTLQKNKHTDYL